MATIHLQFDINYDTTELEATVETIKELIGNGATAGRTLDNKVCWSFYPENSNY